MISSLVGEELNAVCFVMDYVEFHFNGPVVRSLSHPRVETLDGSMEFPAPGSRDALCALIGRAVSDIDLVEGVSLTIRFVGDGAVLIRLDTGSEAAHFVPGPDEPIQVF